MRNQCFLAALRDRASRAYLTVGPIFAVFAVALFVIGYGLSAFVSRLSPIAQAPMPANPRAHALPGYITYIQV